MTRPPALACLVLVSAAAVSAAGDLDGTWKAVALEAAGKKTPVAALDGVTVVVKGGTFTLKNGDKVVEEAALTLDPGKTPRRLTLTPLKGPRKGKDHPGIYAVDGARLTLCWATPGKDRPAAFAATAEGGTFLLVLEPVKPKP